MKILACHLNQIRKLSKYYVFAYKRNLGQAIQKCVKNQRLANTNNIAQFNKQKNKTILQQLIIFYNINSQDEQHTLKPYRQIEIQKSKTPTHNK